jgi:hypothetical protein
MKDAIKDVEWSKNMSDVVFNSLKKILNETAIDKDFVNRLNISNQQIYSKHHPYHILQYAYKKLEYGETSKKILLNWIQIIKNKTRNKKINTSIKNIIYFIIYTCLHKIKLNLENFTRNFNSFDFKRINP